MHRVTTVLMPRHQRLRRVRPAAASVLAGFIVAFTPSAAIAAPTPHQPDDTIDTAIVHQVPQLPLTIDGASVSPVTILQYSGQPLYMAAMPDPGTDGQLVAFTERADFERFVREHGGPANALAPPRVATAAQIRISPASSRPAQGSTQAISGGSYIYEHTWAGGLQLWVANGLGWPDLTQLTLTRDWWIRTSWNDQASSAWPDTGGCVSGCGQMLWEHSWWGGSALWIPYGFWDPDLEQFGWNDRVSSFGSYGVRLG